SGQGRILSPRGGHQGITGNARDPRSLRRVSSRASRNVSCRRSESLKSMAAQRPFRFGVTGISARSRKEWVEKAQKVEALGFATLLMWDHFDDRLAPLPALLAAAGATTSLRLAPCVLSNDYRHPALLAREAATIDLISDGRFELGLGAGWSRDEYQRAGLPFDPPSVRVSRLAESVQILKGLFADAPLTFHGQHYTIAGLHGHPRP